MDVPWAPTLGLRLDLRVDGLGALYGLLATGIGAAVFAYGAAYLPWHLAHDGRPQAESRRFWPWMVLFMASMVRLACARDLVLLFVFFDLTAVASYFLIGFDRQRRESARAGNSRQPPSWSAVPTSKPSCSRTHPSRACWSWRPAATRGCS